MEIKKDSWWYKIYDLNIDLGTEWRNYPQQENLCHFMRVVLFWVPAKLLMIVAVALLVLAQVAFWLSDFYMKWVVGYWMFVVFCTALPTCIYLKQFQYHDKRTKKVAIKTSLPSPFTEWIKAKKQKICPFIEFIDQ